MLQEVGHTITIALWTLGGRKTSKQVYIYNHYIAVSEANANLNKNRIKLAFILSFASWH